MVDSSRKYFARAGGARRLLTSTCLLGWFLVLAGCAAPVAAPAPARLARLTVTNVSDYPWRLSLHSAAGATGRTEKLAPRSVCTLEVPGGTYQIEQMLLDGRSSPELTRQVSFQLEAGRTYRWQLTTLLSDNPDVMP